MYSEPRLRSQHSSAPSSARTATRPLRIGMIGLGTVGMGTWNVLSRNRSLIEARAGRGIEIVAVAARDLQRAASRLGQSAGRHVQMSDDPLQVARHPDVDVLVEVAGGTGPARDWVLAALAAGKHVVTANKALLAIHGEELARAAQQQGRQLAYEAAVAGSVPIIKTLRESLVANQFQSLVGILNGTSNYILTRMSDAGLSFEQALQEAQQRGYAEADPSFDVDGIDAAHKLTLLAANAFGLAVDFNAVHVEGLRTVRQDDVRAAVELGYAVKLLGVARRTCAGVELRVHPALVPTRHALAQVGGAMNGIALHGDACGPAFYSGAGAGAEPTASAVVADLVDLARLTPPVGDGDSGKGVPTWGTHARAATQPAVVPITDVVGAHMLRIVPRAGLCEAAVLRRLARAGVQVQRRMWCHAGDGNAGVPCLVVLTVPVADGVAQAAAHALAEHVQADVRRLRVADF